jgi:hypothetical protein
VGGIWRRSRRGSRHDEDFVFVELRAFGFRKKRDAGFGWSGVAGCAAGAGLTLLCLPSLRPPQTLPVLAQPAHSSTRWLRSRQLASQYQRCAEGGALANPQKDLH